jgi:hypothetical protein
MSTNQKHPFGDIKRGGLHRMLGVHQDEKIRGALIDKIVNADIGTVVEGHTVTTKLKRRAVFAQNARDFKH